MPKKSVKTSKPDSGKKEDMMDYMSPLERGERKTVIMKSIHRAPYPPCAISNVVSHLYVAFKQNQRKMALYAKKKMPVFFDPKIFASSQTQFKIKGYPAVKATFFSRRSQTLTGGVSEDHNRLIAWSIMGYIKKKFGVDVKMSHVVTKNIVAHVYMTHGVNLLGVYTEIPDRCEYKPECIDCCRITSTFGKPRVFLIFSTGAVLLVGNKSMAEVEELYVEACELASKYKTTDKNGKAMAQKYKQKRRMVHEEAVKTTNIEIETAMGMKRRKVSGVAKHNIVKSTSLGLYDDMFDFDSSASAAYLKMVREEEERMGDRDSQNMPSFCPSSTLMLT